MTISQKLKYQVCVSKIDGCPPRDCRQVAGRYYRFVHSDIKHQNNFWPVRRINPARKLPGTPSRQCEEWGLSVYDTEDNAKKAFRVLSVTFKNFIKTVGTHVAAVSIAFDDGMMDPTDETGHSNFHEFDSTDLIHKTTMLGPIVEVTQ